MKRLLILWLCTLPFCAMAQPCTISNSLGCDCLDGSNECDLLPDIGISTDLLMDASANPEISGELGVSISTPNTGHGPLRIVATDFFVCGEDTINSPGGFPGLCPDGTEPRQLIKQLIYHKNPDGTMSQWDRWAGSMTYHASHGHMHVDDWGVYSLRTPTSDPDPLSWPIVAEGAKLGFCLMDYGSCNYYYGHCRDASGAIMTTDAPNYGLGGGGYSCGMTNQGISAGWTDIYYHYLDGMQIPIPSTVCNGDYMLVVQVDPNNYFLEENDDNNVAAVPITLTQQTGFSSFNIALSEGSTTICPGESVTLSVPFSAESYSWSNGMSGSSISVSEPGTYTVTVSTGVCGEVTSDELVLELAAVDAPSATGDTVCNSGVMTLQAFGEGLPVHWYDAPEGGTLLDTGEFFVTPELSESTSYWAAVEKPFPGQISQTGQAWHTGASFYSGSTFNGALIFDVQREVWLRSVKVYTDQAAVRTIEWRSSDGTVLGSQTLNIPSGESRVELDFLLLPGLDYQLGTQTAQNIAALGTESPRLRRSSSGVSMPYSASGILQIKDTNFGSSLYYYFYDWEIAEPDLLCESPRQEVLARVEICTGLPQSAAPLSFSMNPNPAVQESVIRAEFERPGALQFRLMDMTGRVLQTQQELMSGSVWQYVVPTSTLPSGMYWVELTCGDQQVREALQVLQP